MLDFSVQVSGVAWTFANCSDGAAYMHVSYAGARASPLLSCTAKALLKVAHTPLSFSLGQYQRSLFITITGDTADGGNILQGQATI